MEEVKTKQTTNKIKQHKQREESYQTDFEKNSEK